MLQSACLTFGFSLAVVVIVVSMVIFSACKKTPVEDKKASSR